MARQLIVERFVTQGKILEKVGLPEGVLCKARYPICDLGEFNRNNRVYEKAVWDKVLGDSEVLERMKSRSLFMQEEHPEEGNQTKTGHIAGIVTGIDVDEATNKVFMNAEVLDTPYGRIVDTLLKAGCGLGVSTRAEGELEEIVSEDSKDKEEEGGEDKKKFRVIPDAYKFITVDFTADPSTYSSYPEKVERDLVGIVKAGVDNEKIDRDFAATVLECMKIPEAVALLESITHDKHHKECKCKTSEKKCTKGCTNAIVEAKTYSGKEAEKKEAELEAQGYVRSKDDCGAYCYRWDKVGEPTWRANYRTSDSLGRFIIYMDTDKDSDESRKIKESKSICKACGWTGWRHPDNDRCPKCKEKLQDMPKHKDESISEGQFKNIDVDIRDMIKKDMPDNEIIDILSKQFPAIQLVVDKEYLANIRAQVSKDTTNESKVTYASLVKELEKITTHDKIIDWVIKLQHNIDDLGLTFEQKKELFAKAQAASKNVKDWPNKNESKANEAQHPWDVNYTLKDFKVGDMVEFRDTGYDEHDAVYCTPGKKYKIVQIPKTEPLIDSPNESYFVVVDDKGEHSDLSFWLFLPAGRNESKVNEIYEDDLQEISFIRNYLIGQKGWSYKSKKDALNFVIRSPYRISIERFEHAIPHGTSGGKYALIDLSTGSDKPLMWGSFKEVFNAHQKRVRDSGYTEEETPMLESGQVNRMFGSRWHKQPVTIHDLMPMTSTPTPCPTCGKDMVDAGPASAGGKKRVKACPDCDSDMLANESEETSKDFDASPILSKLSDNLVIDYYNHAIKVGVSEDHLRQVEKELKKRGLWQSNESKVLEKMDPDMQEVADLSKKFGFGTVEWQDAMIARIRRKLKAGQQLAGIDISFIETQLMHNKTTEVEDLEKMWNASNKNVPNESKVNEFRKECKYCGGEIDDKNKICFDCGKYNGVEEAKNESNVGDLRDELENFNGATYVESEGGDTLRIDFDNGGSVWFRSRSDGSIEIDGGAGKYSNAIKAFAKKKNITHIHLSESKTNEIVCDKCGRLCPGDLVTGITGPNREYHESGKCAEDEKEKKESTLRENISREQWEVIHQAIGDVMQDFKKITGTDGYKLIDVHGQFHQKEVDKTAPKISAFVEKNYPELYNNRTAYEEGFLYELDDKIMDAFSDEAVEKAGGYDKVYGKNESKVNEYLAVPPDKMETISLEQAKALGMEYLKNYDVRGSQKDILQRGIETISKAKTAQEVENAVQELDNNLEESKTNEVIKKVGDKWQVQSHKGKNLGTYDTEEEAKKRLKQVEFFKHKNESIKEAVDCKYCSGTGADKNGKKCVACAGTGETKIKESIAPGSDDVGSIRIAILDDEDKKDVELQKHIKSKRLGLEGNELWATEGDMEMVSQFGNLDIRTGEGNQSKTNEDYNDRFKVGLQVIVKGDDDVGMPSWDGTIVKRSSTTAIVRDDKDGEEEEVSLKQLYLPGDDDMDERITLGEARITEALAKCKECGGDAKIEKVDGDYVASCKQCSNEYHGCDYKPMTTKGWNKQNEAISDAKTPEEKIAMAAAMFASFGTGQTITAFIKGQGLDDTQIQQAIELSKKPRLSEAIIDEDWKKALAGILLAGTVALAPMATAHAADNSGLMNSAWKVLGGVLNKTAGVDTSSPESVLSDLVSGIIKSKTTNTTTSTNQSTGSPITTSTTHAMNRLEIKLRVFLKANPNATIQQIRQFADENNYDRTEVDQMMYHIASEAANESKKNEGVIPVAKETLNENFIPIDFESMLKEFDALEIVGEKGKKMLREAKTVKDFTQVAFKLVNEAKRELALIIAERDKSLERITELETAYGNDAIVYSEKIAELTKGLLTKDKEKKTMGESFAKQLKEEKIKLAEQLVIDVKKIYEEKMDSMKAAHEQQIREMKESFEKEKFDAIIEGKIKESGLQLTEAIATLLHSAKSVEEVDNLISEYRYSLKESMLHSSRPSEVKIGIAGPSNPDSGLLAETKRLVTTIK